MFERGLALSIFLLFISFPAAAQAVNAAKPDQAVAPQFAYRSDFWRNLHHTLYAFASHEPAAGRVRRIRLTEADLALRDALEGGARGVWQEAVGWYAANLVTRDLLFDDAMVALGDALNGAEESAPEASDVPAELHAVLMSAAPVYRAHWWPRHREANAAWRAMAAPTVASHGSAIAVRLARAYDAPWFDAPVPVALTAYANWAGAYAAIPPTRLTIATTDPRAHDIAAFEILMHEASHGVVGPLRGRLAMIVASETARPGVNAAALRPDLWHQILFYVTGKVVADAFPGYVAYADNNDLWRVAWPGRTRQALSLHLDPYLDGATTLDAALTALVRDLLANPPAG